MRTLEQHIAKQPTLSDRGNVWSYKGVFYFYEIGMEREDGAIGGTIYKMCNGAMVGAFRIEPDGRIARFPFTV